MAARKKKIPKGKPLPMPRMPRGSEPGKLPTLKKPKTIKPPKVKSPKFRATGNVAPSLPTLKGRRRQPRRPKI